MRNIFNNSADKSILLIIVFLIIVLGDVLTKIFFNLEGHSPSKYVKAFLLVPLILLSFQNQRKLFIYLSISFLLFLFGSISISLDRLIENLPQFFEYYFFVLFFTAFLDLKWKKIGVTLELVFLFHALIMVIAAIFELRFFKTYLHSERIGYLPFFNSQNEFSYIIMAGITFFAAQVKKDKIFSILKVVFMVFAGLLLGTKAVALFVILLGSYYLFFKSRPKTYLSILTLASATVLIFWGNIASFFKVNYNALYGVYQTEGFLSFLSSKRTVLIFDRFNKNQEDIDLTNYLLGGYDLNNIYEMSILDIPFFFGLIGATLYCYIVYKFVFKRVVMNQLLIVYLLFVTGISFVAGYLFENTSAQIYTLLVAVYLSENYDNDFLESERKKENINA